LLRVRLDSPMRTRLSPRRSLHPAVVFASFLRMRSVTSRAAAVR